ncbi:metal-dependent hydrolase [Desulfonatronum thiodismutans]|uniref:metal-dependent hydrolase n=1 Tax=Desulfonatronum thiodismutans TaxID=159290 RepID=UPI0004DB82D2|nr:metal-dependent hydrolase [Desulfonatronum thiodismutans]
MEHRLIWHGHAAFQIVTPSLSVLIDPWFEGNPSSGTSHEALDKVDLVLITHDHGDHVGQAVEICRRTGAHLLGVVETVARLKGLGLPDDQVVNGIGMNIGGTVRFHTLQATMVQAQHSSETGLAVGYILTLEDGTCVYHAGDTGIFSTMELYGRLFNIDLALLPIGGVFTMDPRQAAMACAMLQCEEVVPMHWGSFPVLEQNCDNFAEQLGIHAPKVRLNAMKPGQTLIMGKQNLDFAARIAEE